MNKFKEAKSVDCQKKLDRMLFNGSGGEEQVLTTHNQNTDTILCNVCDNSVAQEVWFMSHILGLYFMMM